MCSFYASRSQKPKKLLNLTVFLALLGSASVKDARKHWWNWPLEEAVHRLRSPALTDPKYLMLLRVRIYVWTNEHILIFKWCSFEISKQQSDITFNVFHWEKQIFVIDTSYSWASFNFHFNWTLWTFCGKSYVQLQSWFTKHVIVVVLVAAVVDDDVVVVETKYTAVIHEMAFTWKESVKRVQILLKCPSTSMLNSCLKLKTMFLIRVIHFAF